MKRLLLLLLLIALSGSALPQGGTVTRMEEPDELFKNQDSFLKYYGTWVKLSANFVALDAGRRPIKKGPFLKALLTGNYLPMRLKTDGQFPYYQLYTLSPAQKKEYAPMIQGWANDDYNYYLMEGKAFPQFSFRDMDGQLYTNANTKGKILVLKGWFIACHNCVLEIPELNKLVARYKNRKDVLFISIATDPAADLKAFLAKKPFAYAVVPGQDYFAKVLGINEFPTHIIVDKQGVIKKVVGTAEELEAALSPLTP
jgi:peroxiredoxin